MPRNSRKPEPNPLYALAGAGDLAMEKIREFSRIASDKIGALETADPVAVSDRVQERIEERADALAMAIRSASTDIRLQAIELTERAQAAVQSMLIQAGDTYDALSERGKGAVIRMRGGQNGSRRQGGRQISRSTASSSGNSRPKSSSGTRKRTASKGRTATTATGSGRRSTRGTSGSKSTSSGRSSGRSTSTKVAASPMPSESSTSTAIRSSYSAKPGTTAKSPSTIYGKPSE